MKLSRRSALQGAGVLGVAMVIGCDDQDAVPPDGGMETPLDAGADAGPRGRDGGPAPMGPFQHGVASGDPLPDAVILWTRVTADAADDVALEWEMSSSPAFTTLDAMGAASATASTDFTAKIDATGLMPATTYYYRFRITGTTDVSPIGRTRTAPANDADVAALRFAVCSCASLAHGWFHGYRNIASRADLDAVLHLGDYIYEYGADDYGATRDYDPPHEIVSLDDYRRRYRQYRSDADLQEAHRQHAFITVWDDHETANNSWRDGAGNHDADEGAWAARKQAAQQAYSEYMPIRTADPSRIWRSLRFGRLAELVMLDTRIEGRTEQGEGAPADRTLLSEAQETFLFERLTTSESQWKVIGQQVMFSPLPVITNDDQWDGYPEARNRVLEALRTGGVDGAAIEDVIVLTGDIHTAWAIEAIEDPMAAPLPAPAAVEFVVPGITSPPLTTPGSAIKGSISDVLAERAPHIKYYDLTHRGYVVLDVTAERTQAAFVRLDDVLAPYDTSESPGGTWETASGASRLTEGTPQAPRSGAPALAP